MNANALRNLFFFLCLMIFCFSCKDAAKENLDQARQIFNRVEIGMSHKDGCWYFGSHCHEEKPHYTYKKDVGKSFSKKEYVVGMYIRNNTVARVDIIQPHYEGKTRNSDKGVIIAEKGISILEALGSVGADFTKP